MDKYNIVSDKVEVSFKIDGVVYNDLIQYCKLNDLDIQNIINKSFIGGFNIERYGLLNNGSQEVIEVEKVVIKEIEKPIEVIKEVEVIREVEKPVEIIKEVEVIKEVEKPIEIIKEIEIVKEVPVEKIKYITDDNKTNELILEIERLKNELDLIKKQKPKEIEIIKEVVVDSDPKLKSKLDALQKTIQSLRKDNIDKDNKIKELELVKKEIEGTFDEQKALFLKGSNLNDKLYK